MRTILLVSLIVTLGVLIGVGSAPASDVTYPEGSSSRAINLGNGAHAFVFFNDVDDIFVHSVDFFTDLMLASAPPFTGYAFWFNFEGFNQGYLQYGVYTCNSSNFVFCNVSGIRRGTFLL